MSLTDKNQKCAVCSAYLFSEDDIVYCPVCGAPHHRECYNSIGKCGFEEYHGTDKQFSREALAEEPEKTETAPQAEEQLRCFRCGMPLDKGARYCNNCGAPAGMEMPPFVASPFEQKDIIKEETPIAEGVSAKDAAKVVRNNTFRYVPKFLKLNRLNKTSWNWAAFLLPHGWFAYRKMYKESIITCLLTVASVIMNVPFNLAIAQLPIPETEQTLQNTIELAEYYSQFMGEIGFLPLFLSFLGLTLGLAVRVVSGMYGDYIYKERVIMSVGLIKEAEDSEAAEEKYSGVSFIGFFIAVFAVEFIPSILSMFLL
ncbi:MAG: DUF2628 domain-containing protein [Clostridia bacterium]|nr:DUF2628 domain-containing protein [Clostridia bacterium]